MNGDVGDLLREGMERFTADLRAPAGMACRAVRRRRRRLAVRSAAGVLAAAAVAVGVAVAGVPGGRGTGTGVPATTAAYVVRRVDSALSAAEPAAIGQMTIAASRSAVPGTTAAATTAEEWSYGGRWRWVRNSPAGHPVYDMGSSASSVYSVVDYQTRTWARQSGAGSLKEPKPGSRGCAAGLVLPWAVLAGSGSSSGSVPVSVATALRTAVSCGTLAVAGRQRVGGIEAIKLTSRPGGPVSETIWVNPGTYLPVRVVAVGRAAPGQTLIQQTADIAWLPPTARNLANLTVPIPAGFRRVPLAQAVNSVRSHIPGTPPLKSTTRCRPAPGGVVCRRGAGDTSGRDQGHR